MTRAEPRGAASRWRLGAVLWLLGMPGVLAVLWALLPPLMAHQALLPLPLWAVVALSGLQTAVLLACAVAAGVWLAPRVGLQAPVVAACLSERPAAPAARAQLVPGLWAGALAAAWLWGLAQVAPPELRSAAPGGAGALAVKLLYGGITEELLVRWGLMTLLAWLGWRLLQRGKGPVSRGVMAAAVVVSAVLFAVGHLPAAQAMAGALTPGVVAFVLVGNTAFGLLAGWLFARHGLEAAMLAHVLAHALSHPWL